MLFLQYISAIRTTTFFSLFANSLNVFSYHNNRCWYCSILDCLSKKDSNTVLPLKLVKPELSPCQNDCRCQICSVLLWQIWMAKQESGWHCPYVAMIASKRPESSLPRNPKYRTITSIDFWPCHPTNCMRNCERRF